MTRDEKFDKLMGWLCGLLLMLIIFSVPGAEASEYRRYVDIDVDAKSNAKSVSASESTADASALSESTSSNGDQISMNSSQFYALSLQHPNAVNCFVGAQGGGQDADVNSGKSGFLGFHYLNKSCWMKSLANEERDIELNARLKCHDRHYRNAIAYDRPKGVDKRQHCINLVVASGNAQMAEHRASLDELIRQQDLAQERLEQCHDRVDDANERTERCLETAIAK